MSRNNNSNNKISTKNLYKINSANECADSMLTRINECFQDSIKGLPKIKSAIVSAVNDDGTVDVYFPPNDKKFFTRISNQGAFSLEVGDGVELMLKNGTFDNCWVIAKHGVNRTDMNTTQFYKNSTNVNNNQNNIDSSSIVGVTKTSQLINDSGFITKNSPTIDTPTLYSAKLTGIPTAPTQDLDDNSTKIATTAYVKKVADNISITIDTELNDTSSNPVENKIIAQEINNIKQSIKSIQDILQKLQSQ